MLAKHIPVGRINIAHQGCRASVQIGRITAEEVACGRQKFANGPKIFRNTAVSYNPVRGRDEAWHVWHKVERILWESACRWGAVGTAVAKDEIAWVARTVVLYHIKVHVEPIGAERRDAALELFSRAEAGRQ